MVKYVDHQFFRDYSNLSYYNSIRPGHGVGTPVAQIFVCRQSIHICSKSKK
ncbi:hypothetical protein DPMN_151811 [Dreissena polymorpha]|uniref:Uncharacterized protein n=1 Tax=Dreissena polymorpha TaxID=45954 RepID=A0A9D4J7R3_DREPO|nr:hypothetical protein DPMN_151811 [Dreissena polymorpha]